MKNLQKNISYKNNDTTQAFAKDPGKNSIILTDYRFQKTNQLKKNSKKDKPQQLKKNSKPSRKSNTYQLAKDNKSKKKTSDWKKEQRKKERLYAIKPWREYEDILTNIKGKVAYTLLDIKTIKQQIEDDDDFDLLKNYEAKLNKLKIEAKTIFKDLRIAPSGRLRSSSTLKDKLINELKGKQIELNILISNLKKQFPTHSGGFGAKGRAHEMDTEFLDNSATAPIGKSIDNTFLNNIQIDGKTNNLNVYKSSPKIAKEKSGPLQILGQKYATNSGINKSQLLKNVDSGLSQIATPQQTAFNNTPVGKDRGLGQYTNMNSTNAAGYAWLMGIQGILGQRWEWLHIRGAGLGGATDSTNLVAGTRDANTQMIPFESNIRTLANAVAYNKMKYSKLDVEWSATGIKAKHAFDTITIKWRLVKTDNSIQTHGEANFSPLHTGSNISKGEVDKLEGALKEARDKV